jgi:hypothetical protein
LLIVCELRSPYKRLHGRLAVTFPGADACSFYILSQIAGDQVFHQPLLRIVRRNDSATVNHPHTFRFVDKGGRPYFAKHLPMKRSASNRLACLVCNAAEATNTGLAERTLRAKLTTHMEKETLCRVRQLGLSPYVRACAFKGCADDLPRDCRTSWTWNFGKIAPDPFGQALDYCTPDEMYFGNCA